LGPPSPPPPAAAPVFAGFSSYGNSSVAAQVWLPYNRRKSRVVFVLLAVFFGAFGGHNFYAGYTKKGVIQACITAFSCFFGSLISWVWAIVEACTIEQDSNGNAFI
jgi:TM2 domain-containing membrane protein YozV